MRWRGSSATTDALLRSPWLRGAAAPPAPPALVCLPDTGRGASMFDAWEAAMPPWLGVAAVQPPGREDRYAEPPVDRLDALTRGIADSLAGLEPAVLFGHSLGALVAFELARELRRRGAGAPAALLVSGFRAPHLPDREPPLRGLDDAAIARALVHRYGAPAELVSTPELLALMAPAIRADLTLSETYAFVPEAPLDCPIYVYRGVRDPHVTRREAGAWAAHTCAGFGVRVHAGAHHLPRGRWAPVLAPVRRDVETVLRPR